MHQHAQGAAGGLGRILLTQRTRRGVAGIGKHLLVGLGQLLIQAVERVDWEEDLAAHLDQRRPSRARQLMRDARNGLDVCRDVLAHHAIATCCRLSERAVDVGE